VTVPGKAAELRRQADLARFEAESEVIRGLNLDVRILARELYGREGRDLDVAVHVTSLRGRVTALR
jgi:hypothetical protein